MFQHEENGQGRREEIGDDRGHGRTLNTQGGEAQPAVDQDPVQENVYDVAQNAGDHDDLRKSQALEHCGGGGRGAEDQHGQGQNPNIGDAVAQDLVLNAHDLKQFIGKYQEEQEGQDGQERISDEGSLRDLGDPAQVLRADVLGHQNGGAAADSDNDGDDHLVGNGGVADGGEELRVDMTQHGPVDPELELQT